jgi:hypothetical protein
MEVNLRQHFFLLSYLIGFVVCSACAYGRFSNGVETWWNAVPYAWAKGFDTHPVNTIIGKTPHAQSQSNHSLTKCAPEYFFCNASASKTKTPCCDINSDCKCDLVCGGNMGVWDCKTSPPTNWPAVPVESGYDATFGCSYPCSSAVSNTTCIRVNVSVPTTAAPANKCEFDKESAARQDACAELPATWNWFWMPFTGAYFNAYLHRHAFSAGFGYWAWVPFAVLLGCLYRWLLVALQTAGICQEWGCTSGDWLGLEIRGAKSRDAAEVFADTMLVFCVSRFISLLLHVTCNLAVTELLFHCFS